MAPHENSLWTFYDLAKKILIKIGLKQHPTSPCIFYGTLIQGLPPLYLGLYVDDFYYFSKSPEVETLFESKFGSEISITFNGPVSYFLGITFTHTKSPSGKVKIHLSQEAFIDHLLEMTNLQSPTVVTARTPYRNGFPVDAIPQLPSQDEPSKIKHFIQVLIGSLNWLSISTRPDITTITAMIAKYVSKPNQQYINAAKRVIKYLKGTKDLGITFSSTSDQSLEAHVKFPIADPTTGLADANWCPQDASKPKPNSTEQLDLFKSRSISGFLLWFNGPLHWSSQRQHITARSTAEAEIYATDECAKYITHL